MSYFWAKAVHLSQHIYFDIFNLYSIYVVASSYADGGKKDFTDEAGAADDVRLGDPRAARAAGSLRSPKLTLRIVGQSYSQRWWASYRHPCHRERRIQRIHVANSIKHRSQR